ncbi:MAG: FlgD immunoglobulin-like domain containing protein, partial [Candidatus Cloacimonadaceae bacterium]|nr:FlgD immunoglobulin-like domain containing protein [Candidatus Cloacimonadaceae bacterium]
SAGDVSFAIFNSKGQKIRTFHKTHQKPGHYHLHWDGKDGRGNFISSGVYVIRMTTGKFSSTKSVVLMK